MIGRESLAPDRLREGQLDRRAHLPLYIQLRDALLREIRRRELKSGDRFPSETEIGQRYRVSRATIRQALNELAAEGVIERVQGKGTFLRSPRIHHVPLLTSFTENMRSQGYVPSRRVLVSVETSAPSDVAGHLGVEQGTLCRFLRRLFLADSLVVGVAETWLPSELLLGHGDLFEPDRLEEQSLYELLQGQPIGLALVQGIETITSGLADQEHAELLKYEVGRPVLVVARITYGLEDRVIEWTRMVFAGDRYEYPVQIQRPRMPQS